MAEPSEPLFHVGRAHQFARAGSTYTSSESSNQYDVHHVDHTQENLTRNLPTKRKPKRLDSDSDDLTKLTRTRDLIVHNVSDHEHSGGGGLATEGHVKSTDSAFHSRNKLTAHEHGEHLHDQDQRQYGHGDSHSRSSLPASTSTTIQYSIASSANSLNISKHGCRSDSDMATKLAAELSKENASLRSRLKGVNVLSTLLSEAREEIANLNTQKNKQEIAVENLQSRLHKLGADSSVDLADHEIFMPGHDKQFLNSLISENMRLQKALKNGTKDATAVVKDEQQAERIKKLETIIQQLTQQRREKEKKIQELQDLMKSSSEEKDLELVRLREAVEKSTKAQENAEAICESLTDQAEQLREQVKAASQKASEESSKQQKDQDDRQKESDKLEQQVAKLKRTASNLKPEEQVRILEQQVDQLEKENERLTEQLKEVIGMNTRWQRYNDQREAYVIKLSKSSYQQQSKITVYEQQISDLTKSNEELKKENEQLKQEDQDKRDAALCSADQQLAIKDEEIQELKEQLKEMKELVEAVSSQHTSTFDEDDRERIQVLEQQVTTFASDFKDERKDRERIQGLYTDALKELKEKDRYIEDLQFRQRSPVTPVAAYGVPQYTLYNRQSSTCRQDLVARGMRRQQYYGEDFPDLPTDVEIDGGAPRANDIPDGTTGLDMPRDGDDFIDIDNMDNKEGGDDPLQCPHCFRGFRVSEVEKFMQHTTTCLENN